MIRRGLPICVLSAPALHGEEIGGLFCWENETEAVLGDWCIPRSPLPHRAKSNDAGSIGTHPFANSAKGWGTLFIGDLKDGPPAGPFLYNVVPWPAPHLY